MNNQLHKQEEMRVLSTIQMGTNDFEEALIQRFPVGAANYNKPELIVSALGVSFQELWE